MQLTEITDEQFGELLTYDVELIRSNHAGLVVSIMTSAKRGDYTLLHNPFDGTGLLIENSTRGQSVHDYVRAVPALLRA
jgi:hypothetical protein